MEILQAVIDGILIGGVYGLVAIGLTMIFGVMKIINFAHGAILMSGMYATFWIFQILQINPYLSLPLTFAIMFVFGMLIQKVTIQPIQNAPEHNQLLVTLGLLLFLENLALLIFSPDFRSVELPWLRNAIFAGPFALDKPRLIAFAFAVALSLALYLFLKNTSLGRAIRATSQERDGSSLVGVNVNRINRITFGLGSACAGVAGALIVPFFYTSPHAGGAFLLKSFVITVLGGLGNFIGALVGGLIIGVGESVGAIYLPGTLKELVTYIIFIAILFFRPTGLFGGGEGS